MRATSRDMSLKDQVKRLIFQTFLLLPQCVLQSRLGDETMKDTRKDKDRRTHNFNLDVPEVSWIYDEAAPWKKNLRTPMNIYLHYLPEEMSSPKDDDGVLLEHWQCVFTSQNLHVSAERWNYGRFVVLFRSLYMYLKVLPAHKIFKASKLVKGSSRVVHKISQDTLYNSFGAIKPERVEIGKIETPFGTIELSVSYRKDVAFATARQEVIPVDSIIPDYAPSLSKNIPIRVVSNPALQEGRQRSSTAGAMRRGSKKALTEAFSQPAMGHERLSFSPPFVGAQSMWDEKPEPRRMGMRERQLSEPPFPVLAKSPRSSSGAPMGTVAVSSSHSVEAYSLSPRGEELSIDTILGRMSEDNRELDRVLTAVSPPSFSMYEKALHEAPAPFDGPVFSIEGSFSRDEEMDVNSFVRFCQAKPNLYIVEEERKNMVKFLNFVKEQRKDK